jgi:hypothetical protein
MAPSDDDWPEELRPLAEALPEFERRVLLLRLGV